MVSSVQGQFISLFCETAFYGMYTMLFVLLLANFRQSKSVARSIKIIRTLTIIQYLMVTAHISLAFYQNYIAFAVKDNASEEFERLGAAPFTLTQLVLEWTNCAIADSILIWRVWVLWNKQLYVIILPVILVILSTTSGYLVVYTMTLVDSSSDSNFGDLFGPAVEKWAILLAVCTVITNIFCTGMIAGRIWWHNRETQQALGVSGMPHRYRTIFYGVIESGAIYLIAWASDVQTIIAILLFLINTAAVVPMLDIISQLTGIVPALIVILVSRNVDAAKHHEEVMSTMHYNRNSRADATSHMDFDTRGDYDTRSTGTLEVIPMHLTNSFEPESPGPEKRIMFADDKSTEKANIATRTTISGTTSRTGTTQVETVGSKEDERLYKLP